jgi:hypothetical protein
MSTTRSPYPKKVPRSVTAMSSGGAPLDAGLLPARDALRPSPTFLTAPIIPSG